MIERIEVGCGAGVNTHVRRFQCGCGISFTNTLYLTPHADTCLLNNDEYACAFPGCNKKFQMTPRSWGVLKEHQRVHSREKPFVCTFPGCNKKFQITPRSWGVLKEHQRVHSREKPFVCTFCDKGFSHKNVLTVHTRIHTGEKPFKCELDSCGLAFKSSSHLAKHRRTHR
jgi:hypothetical protein